MKRINTITDLIDVLEYARREWGNDVPIRLTMREDYATHQISSSALYITLGKDGTVYITNFDFGGGK